MLHPSGIGILVGGFPHSYSRARESGFRPVICALLYLFFSVFLGGASVRNMSSATISRVVLLQNNWVWKVDELINKGVGLQRELIFLWYFYSENRPCKVQQNDVFWNPVATRASPRCLLFSTSCE